MQKKDIIYVDVEDDITAIIGKVKGATEKIVALVPPKRMGVLQSAVNLRLLARTAKHADKRLVIITANSALVGLAASAKIPVAKTLQSRPEIAEVPAVSGDDEEVIDGGELPIGDHAKMPHDSEEETVPGDAIDEIDIDGEPAPKPVKPKKAAKKKGIKVPDFGMFRKKLILFAAGGVFLIAFLVWAIWIAPHATVIVSARTSDIDVQQPVTLSESADVDSEKMTLPWITQTTKQSDSVEFTPTGKKDVGEKASGTVVFSNCVSTQARTINSGTYISADGVSYIVQSTVVVPGGTPIGGPGGFGPCVTPGQSAPVKVVAEEVGDEYNVPAGTEFTVAGYPSSMSADTTDGISGGSSKTVTVVSVEDVKKAQEQLTDDASDDVKKELMDMFEGDATVIEDSFTITPGSPEVTPGIGEETTSSKATLAVEITYSITGIADAALDEFLRDTIETQLGEDSGKRIYESGASSARLTDFTLSSDKKKATVQLAATGKVGPEIDDNQIKEIVKGKRFGDIESELKAIDGISDVDLKLTPPWVFNAPDDVNKITIEFKLQKENG